MRKILTITILLTVLIGVTFSYAQLAQLWNTGQTTSFATGDDGNLRTGSAWPSPRFTDNADGTVTDGLTGLMWLKDANCFGYQTWTNALTTVADFNLHTNSYFCSGYSATYSDWRLPNRKELMSLIDRSRWNPALPSGHPFVKVSSNYWSGSAALSSSETSTGSWTTNGGWSTVSTGGSAWSLSISTGSADRIPTSFGCTVWPVRSVATPGNTLLAVSPTNADFGNIVVSAGSTPQEFTISNSGYGDLAISSIGTAGTNAAMFHVSLGGADPCPSFSPTIPPNGSCTVLVTFTPASGGLKAADLRINSNDPASPEFSAPLNGTGVYLLSLTKAGTGAGTVTSSPAGIDCGADCSETYATGTTVTLTASPDAGSSFTGWTNGGTWSTSGAGSCTGTSCTLTMNAGTSVIATFSSEASMTLLTPNGGESIKRGSTYSITWSYSGAPGSTVTIELLKGGIVNKILASSAPVGSNGSGTYTWNVARNQALGSDYTIRITGTSGVSDTSNGYFSVAK